MTQRNFGWIQTERGSPYFREESGRSWAPIGQNDAISWPELHGLFRRRDVASVESYLRWISEQGVTCLRVMMEYAQVRHRYIERPIGSFVPAMVQLWDDLFVLCERYGLRLLLTPFDTFWMWRQWRWHPYNQINSGTLDHPSRLLLCRETRMAIKARFTFAVKRWSGSGALFAWDLWNEIHPAHAKDSAEPFPEFIHDLSQHVRDLEIELHGRSHPQTVSLFGPELKLQPDQPMRDPIFRHPDLDFATIHIYETGTIDHPRNTVAPALAMGRQVRECLAEITDQRPFLDTEHGPIHTFKDKKKTLPEVFDDEYFRHMQWAHLASGGAGGGMRWPNRHPHVLTVGMRSSQGSLSKFLPLVDWGSFHRVNLNEEIRASAPHLACFGCGDRDQAIVWLLRKRTLASDGRVSQTADPLKTRLIVPGLRPRLYRVVAWDTATGVEMDRFEGEASSDGLSFQPPPFVADVALAIVPA